MKKIYQAIGLIFLVAGLLVWWYIPQLQVDQLNISMNNTVERANLENQYRVTIIQTLGGLVVIAGLFFTYEKIITLKDGQVTERFTNAIEQLGKDQLELKLGGIYALERIANESESDYWPIMEILTAYVRKNSSAEILENKKITSLAMDIQANESTTKEVLEARKMSLDIQAVLTVLGRRKKSFNNGEANHLNLRGTCLQEADLEKAHLEGANLNLAHLEGTHLYNAHLEGISLRGAHLEGADLNFVHLEGAHLYNAHLEGANLFNAHFEEAELKKAHLEGAYLDVAHLEGADLEEAHLEGAIYLTINQLSKVKTLYNAKLDEKLFIKLKNKQPALFEKPNE